jgi:hypothetical protein
MTSWRRNEKKREKTPSDEPTVPWNKRRCMRRSTSYTMKKDKVNWHHRMNRRSNSYMRQMIGRSKAAEDSSTGWTDNPVGSTVGLSDAQFESRQRRTKKYSVAPDAPTPWSVEASVYPTALKKLIKRFWPRGQHRIPYIMMNNSPIVWRSTCTPLKNSDVLAVQQVYTYIA